MCDAAITSLMGQKGGLIMARDAVKGQSVCMCVCVCVCKTCWTSTKMYAPARGRVTVLRLLTCNLEVYQSPCQKYVAKCTYIANILNNVLNQGV